MKNRELKPHRNITRVLYTAQQYKEEVRPRYKKKKLFSSPVVLEEGRRPNSVAIASLLPLVQARAKVRKHPLHENGRWLNQHYVLRYIVPKRKLQPVVMTKSPQVVPSICIRRRDVVVFGFFSLEVVDSLTSLRLRVVSHTKERIYYHLPEKKKGEERKTKGERRKEKRRKEKGERSAR